MKNKTYSAEFKLGAARMVVDEKIQAAQVCRDLGVSSSALSRWAADYREHSEGAFPGKGNLTPQDAKIRELEKENRRLRMERDLLKKTMSLFVEPESSGIAR